MKHYIDLNMYYEQQSCLQDLKEAQLFLTDGHRYIITSLIIFLISNLLRYFGCAGDNEIPCRIFNVQFIFYLAAA